MILEEVTYIVEENDKTNILIKNDVDDYSSNHTIVIPPIGSTFVHVGKDCCSTAYKVTDIRFIQYDKYFRFSCSVYLKPIESVKNDTNKL